MQASSDLHAKAVDLALPCFDELGLEFVELSIGRQGKTLVFNFTADHLPGGLTMEACAAVNKRIAARFEEVDIFEGDWVVQVASPGLDRPLKGYHDFRRVVGRRIWVQLSEKIDGRGRYSGTLESADEASIVLADGGMKVSLPLNKVSVGKQILSDEE